MFKVSGFGLQGLERRNLESLLPHYKYAPKSSSARSSLERGMQLRCVRSYYNKCLPFLRGEKFITKHSHFCSNGEKTAFVLKQTFSVTVIVLEDGQKVIKKMRLFWVIFKHYQNSVCIGFFRATADFVLHLLQRTRPDIPL